MYQRVSTHGSDLSAVFKKRFNGVSAPVCDCGREGGGVGVVSCVDGGVGREEEGYCCGVVVVGCDVEGGLVVCPGAGWVEAECGGEG